LPGTKSARWLWALSRPAGTLPLPP